MTDIALVSIPELIDELIKRCDVLVIGAEYRDEETGPVRSHSKFRMQGHTWACAGMARALAKECEREAMKLKFPDDDEPKEPLDDHG